MTFSIRSFGLIKPSRKGSCLDIACAFNLISLQAAEDTYPGRKKIFQDITLLVLQVPSHDPFGILLQPSPLQCAQIL